MRKKGRPKEKGVIIMMKEKSRKQGSHQDAGLCQAIVWRHRKGPKLGIQVE